MTHTKQNLTTRHSAFTLVELIVVIVILAILATIAFLSFGSQSSSARDSTRLSDLGSISKGLMVYQSTKGSYPTPDSSIPIYYGTVATGTLGYQGLIGSSVRSNIKAGADGFIDPLDKKEYVYSTNKAKTKFRLMALLENKDSVTLKSNFGNTADAVLDTRIPYLKGDNVSIIYVNTGGTITNIQDNTSIPGVSSTGVDVTVGSASPEVVFLMSNSATPAPLSTNAIGSYVYTDTCPAEYAGFGKVISGTGTRSPSYSYDGKFIVYVKSNSQFLYIKNADDISDGYQLNSITSNSPNFSPDGTYIVYNNFNDNFVYKIRADNKLTTNNGVQILEGNYSMPVFSPDGNYLLYSYYDGYSDFSTIKYKDASDEVKTSLGTGLVNHKGSKFVMSKDSKNLIYATDDNLFTMPLFSNGPGTSIGVGSYFSDIDISPDGNTLLYRDDVEGMNYLHKKSMSDSGTGSVILNNDTNGFSISPDGKFFIYSGNDGIMYKRCME